MIKSALSLIIKSNITALKFSNKKMFSYALNNNKKYFFANEKKTDIKTPDAKAEAAPLQPNKKKLSQYDFEQLIEMHTQQAMAEAFKKLEAVQKKVTQNHATLQQMSKQNEYLQKHAKQIKQKQLKLIQNIQLQQQQLKRVKLRAQKQVEDSKKYSITKIAKELLEAADCINRCKNQAVKEYPESKDPYIVELIQSQKKLVQILKKFQIQEFDPINQQYDPNTQEGLLQIPTPAGCKPNTVATTMRSGYMIQGRLLRSARVGIFC